MIERKNLDIRKAVEESGLYLWQIADFLGMCDGTFSRKLRKELSIDEKQKIFHIIEEIKENKFSEVQ